MNVPQKYIQIACNKICNKIVSKKNKNKHKKINTDVNYANFIRERGKGNYSKGIKEICNKLLACEIMLETDKGKEELKREAALNLTEKFLSDLGSIDPTFLNNGMGNLPAVVSLHFKGEWKPELLHIKSDEVEGYHG